MIYRMEDVLKRMPSSVKFGLWCYNDDAVTGIEKQKSYVQLGPFI